MTIPGEFAERVHLGRAWCAHWLAFAEEMEGLGLHVHECEGPNGWGGPAVTVSADDVSEVEEATPVKLDRHVTQDGLVMLYPSLWLLEPLRRRDDR